MTERFPFAGGDVTLDGSGSGGPWGTNVTYSWRQTSGPTSGVTFDDAASAKPVVTIPALADGAELTFTLTVTGRATVTTHGTAPDTDTATVTAVFDPTARHLRADGGGARRDRWPESPASVNCANVTDAHLAAITGELDLQSDGITALAAGDFDGLIALTSLDLQNNSSLTTLPAGVFDELTALTTLRLDGNTLTTLPAGVFDELTALTDLSLNRNSLTSLSAGVFDELTALEELYLYMQLSVHASRRGVRRADRADELSLIQQLSDHASRRGVRQALCGCTTTLSTLPDDVFEELTALTSLRLQDNPGAPFSPTADGPAR